MPNVVNSVGMRKVANAFWVAKKRSHRFSRYPVTIADLRETVARSAGKVEVKRLPTGFNLGYTPRCLGDLS